MSGPAAILMLVLSPVLLAALALGAYLNYGSLRRSYEDMIGSRMETVAARIASDAETALSLGLPLAGQTTLPHLLVREEETDPVLLSIDVVEPSGKILFSSDESRVGQIDHRDPIIAKASAAAIRSTFDTTEGQVVVRASQAVIQGNLSELSRRIVWTAVAVAVVALLLALAAVWFGLNWFGRRVAETEKTAGGVDVPVEASGSIAAIDEAHRAIEAQLAGPRPTGAG